MIDEEAKAFVKKNFYINWEAFYERNKLEVEAAATDRIKSGSRTPVDQPATSKSRAYCVGEDDR